MDLTWNPSVVKKRKMEAPGSTSLAHSCNNASIHEQWYLAFQNSRDFPLLLMTMSITEATRRMSRHNGRCIALYRSNMSRLGRDGCQPRSTLQRSTVSTRSPPISPVTSSVVDAMPPRDIPPYYHRRG